VRALAAAAPDRLDVLVHNAGLMSHTPEITAEGHAHTFATHVLGPFLLTHLLADRLRAARGRVIWVSSGGMYTQHLDLARAAGLDGRPWDGVVAYAQQKRAQVLLSESFADLLAPEATSHAMHPGWVDTPGVADALPRFHRWLGPLLRTPAEGADTLVWLTGAPVAGETTGRFWLDRRARRTEILPGTRHDARDRRALWELCAAHTGVSCPFPAHLT
jgi:NAD(P)-dependent dehydrogenase (short-subunit alcohol dehydrogenase family)